MGLNWASEIQVDENRVSIRARVTMFSNLQGWICLGLKLLLKWITNLGIVDSVHTIDKTLHQTAPSIYPMNLKNYAFSPGSKMKILSKSPPIV